MTAPADNTLRLASASRLASDEKPTPPKGGYQIRQGFAQHSKTIREVQKVIGLFNPHVITHARREQMMDDPTVAFSQAILRSCVVDDNFCVESQDSKVAALVEYAVREVWYDMALGMSRAIPFGYQGAEKVWKAEPLDLRIQDKSNGTSETLKFDIAWTLDRVKPLDQHHTYLLYDRLNDAWGGIRGPSVNEGEGDIDIKPERAMLWSFMAPFACGKLTGRPMLNQQYTPWYEKQATNLFCDRYFEKKADGSYKAHAPAELDGPNGTKIDGFAFVQNALQALKNGEAITLPGEFSERGDRIVDVELLQDDKRGDMYHPRLEYLELQILKGAMIADRAGSAGRGSGIGTGEAAVHFDILQLLLEEIVTAWFKVVQEQIVNPLVRYNFGEEVLRSSRTYIKSKGISNWMRDLYRVILQQMTQFEVALKDGKVVRAFEYIDFISVCEKLRVPLKPADQLGPLAHTRDDEALGLKPPAGNPGDTNVKGRGGRKPAAQSYALQLQLQDLQGSIKALETKLAAPAPAAAPAAPVQVHTHIEEAVAKIEPIMKFEPHITVKPADVVIQPTPAPVVNNMPIVNVEPAEVTVPPAQVIVQPPVESEPKKKKMKIKRDAQGKIASVESEEIKED